MTLVWTTIIGVGANVLKQIIPLYAVEESLIVAIPQGNEVGAKAVKQITLSEPGAEVQKQIILRGIKVVVEAMKQIIHAKQEAEVSTPSYDEVTVREALSHSSMGGVRGTGGASSGQVTSGASGAGICERPMGDCHLRTIFPMQRTLN